MFFRLCGLAIAAGMLFGVDLASIGAALEGMAEELDLADGEDEWVVSGAKGGAVFGSLLGGALIVSKGRRFSMLMASLPFLIGPLLIITAVCFWQVFCGRLLMGFGFGLASVATPCYLSEVVLPAQRGCFEALYELGIATGMLLSSLLNLLLQALGGEDGRLAGLGTWRWQAGVVPCAFAVPLLILSPLVPESPRWLMQQGTQMSFLSSLKEMARLGRPGARERLHRVKTLRQEDLANIEDLHAEDLANIEDLDAEAEKLEDDLVSLWVEKHRMAGTPLYTASSGVGEQEEDVQRQRTCRLLWRTFGDAKDILLGRIPGARQGRLLALAAAVLNQACASTSILIYAQKLLSDVGVRSQVEQDLQSCILIAAKLLGVTLGLVLVSRVTRRALLSVGGLGCSVSLTLLMVGVLVSSNVLLLTGMGLFVLFFFSTWGVGYWSVVVEVTAVGGPRYASCAQALATATLFGTGWLTSLTFLKVMSLGGYGLLVYVTVAVLMCVYALVWLPETSGHSLEECAHDVEVQAHVNLEDSCAVSTSDSESS